MQQQGGGGRSQYGASPFAAATSTDPISQQQLQLQLQQQQQRLGDPGLGAAEEASPISSRPPAGPHLSSAGNFDEHLLVATGSGGLPEDDALGGDEPDRGGSSGGNRWPRQETLALLKIRSDMDVTFRDATLKGPLWEDVSRKLAELGYKRSAKKCKEKFENVHKYYKRTKEGRAGRQDGKSYRFFTQLEALHTTVGSSSSSAPPPLPITTSTATATTIQSTAAVPVSMPTMPISSVRVPTPQPQAPHNIGLFNPDLSAAAILPGTAAALTPAIGVSFSSDSMSSSSGSEEMDDEDDEMDLEPDLMEAEPSNRLDRKRKRGSSKHSGNSSHKMMEFFEGLMKQVMQKQEALQQRFLEAIEKREQDRMIREEAWKRQEMARLAREHELMAQERAISASRDAAIIAFLQKITGQTIQLPPSVNIPAAPPPPPPPPQVAIPQPQSQSQSQPQPQPPTEVYQKPQPQPPPPQHYSQQQQQQQQQIQHHQNPQTSVEVVRKHQPPMSTEVVVAVPEQQVAPQEMSGGGACEATSSRWPKTEVLALIKLRSGLEPRYQEAGPKGPLWEEISAGMHRMGYKRNPKRCKEKWENINKYFKKVKESNKKRPEDAKTCPYFHELDALYRKKILGNPSSGGIGSSSHQPEDQLQVQQQQPPQPQQQSVTMDPKFQERTDIPAIVPSTQTTEQQNKDIGGSTNIQTSNGDLTATLFGEGSDAGAGVAKKPEDILKEQQHQNRQKLMTNDFDKIEELDSDTNLDEDQEDEYNEDDDDDDDDGDEEAQEEMKMAYKIQYQRPNAGSSSNGGGNGTASFLAMVQ